MTSATGSRLPEDTSQQVTQSANDAKWEETAQSKSEIGATQQETQEMYGMMTHAEVVVDLLDQVRRKANQLVSHQEAGWKDQLAMAKHDVAGAKDQENKTTVLARELGRKIRDVSVQTSSLAKDMAESVNTTSQWLRGMIDEAEHGNEAAKKSLMSDIDHEMTKLVDAEVDFSGQMHKVAQWLLQKSHGSVKRGEDIEASLGKLLAMSEKETMSGIGDVIDRGTKLESEEATNRLWFNGMKSSNLAFQRLVRDKMQDLGVELDMNAVEAAGKVPGLKMDKLDSDVGKLLRGQQARMSARLSQIYEGADDEVAKLMNDASLSEEERRAKTAQIMAEARAKAAELFNRQREIKQRQATLEAQLARYAERVAAAEEEARAAVEQGHLSPAVLNVQKKLHNANAALGRIGVHPLMTSALQTGEADDTLRQLQLRVQGENDRLEREDAEMEREVSALESARAKK